MNTVAVVLRKAPYGSVYTAEGFRTLMGIAVFEMDISVVFIDDGVYALLKNQAPDKLDMKPLGEGFPMLREFDVEKFYIHDESLSERGLTVEDLVIDVEVVNNAQIAQILATAAKVLPF
ncbi:MAG: sulfurtransferase complex subunit TusC [Anaerolineae bacterium]|nr:sulfurtransferase complex subunit TusC [Anaerolineae bacterium]